MMCETNRDQCIQNKDKTGCASLRWDANCVRDCGEWNTICHINRDTCDLVPEECKKKEEYFIIITSVIVGICIAVVLAWLWWHRTIPPPQPESVERTRFRRLSEADKFNKGQRESLLSNVSHLILHLQRVYKPGTLQRKNALELLNTRASLLKRLYPEAYKYVLRRENIKDLNTYIMSLNHSNIPQKIQRERNELLRQCANYTQNRPTPGFNYTVNLEYRGINAPTEERKRAIDVSSSILFDIIERAMDQVSSSSSVEHPNIVYPNQEKFIFYDSDEDTIANKSSSGSPIPVIL
jgi:preprotein translocase subunit SecB